MPGKQLTKAQLFEELAALRQQLAELTAAQSKGTSQPTKDTPPEGEPYFRSILMVQKNNDV